MYFILEALNRLLLKINFQIRNSGKGLFGYYLQKYDSIDFLESKNGIYEILIENCVSQHYFSYKHGGWHYYKALVEEFVKNPNLKYEDSVLFNFYKKFRPKNVVQSFLDDDEDKSFGILNHLPAIALRTFWNLAGNVEQINNYLLVEETQLFGPISPVYGSEQFRRCIRAYELIKKHGYKPETFHDGYISGFFISKGEDYRFCVIAGKHRIAALSVLGQKKILVKPLNDLKLISYDKAENIPIVRSGLIKVDLAKKLVDRYFTENGSGRAITLGLLERS